MQENKIFRQVFFCFCAVAVIATSTNRASAQSSDDSDDSGLSVAWTNPISQVGSSSASVAPLSADTANADSQSLDRNTMMQAMLSGVSGAYQDELGASDSSNKSFQVASGCSGVTVVVYCQIPGESFRRAVVVPFEGIDAARAALRSKYGAGVTTGVQ